MLFSGDTGQPLSFRCPDQYSSVNIIRLEAPSLPKPAPAGNANAGIFRPLQALVKRQRFQ